MTTDTQSQTKDLSCCDANSGERLSDYAIEAEVADQLPRMAAAFKALSDETRLRIVRAMAQSERELCECEIVPRFGLSQPTISYHLKVLREAGIVQGKRRGQWVYYRVSPRVLLGIVRDLVEMA